MKKLAYSVDRIMLEYKEKIESDLKEFANEIIYVDGSELTKENSNFYIKSFIKFTKGGKKKTIFSSLYEKEKEKKYKSLVKKLEEVDILIDIGGPFFSAEFIKKLRSKNKKIQILKFIWDKTDDKTMEDFKSKYDKIFTFEKEDAIKYNLYFRPSFFIEESNEKKEIDCYYLGALREKMRYEYIEKFYEYLKKNNLKFNLKLYVKKKNLKKDYKNKELLIHTPVSYKKNMDMMKKSKVVVELNYFTQKGLTLRTYECIGNRSKLITENKDIKNYDFYNENNIYILEKKEDIEKIPLDFFQKPYEEIDENIFKKYSFKGFIKELLTK